MFNVHLMSLVGPVEQLGRRTYAITSRATRIIGQIALMVPAESETEEDGLPPGQEGGKKRSIPRNERESSPGGEVDPTLQLVSGEENQ